MRRLGAVLTLFAVLATREAKAQPSAAEIETAIGLHRLKTHPATRHAGQLAHYQLAIALYRAKLPQAAYGLFSEIVDEPDSPRFAETLVWLGKLLTDLPDAADVDERISRYDGAALARVKAETPELFYRLEYRLGRFHYRNRHYDAARRALMSVDVASPHFAKSQFLLGMVSVQERRAEDALHAFQRAVVALDELGQGVDDEGRLRDLALLSIARLYYSTAIRTDARGEVVSDRGRLITALKTYDAVDVGSEWWMRAAFESSWAYFVLGDHARALGFIQTIGTFFPQSYDPELELLRTNIYFANCQYDDAATLAARFHERFQPISIELTKQRQSLLRADPNEGFYRFFRAVRDGRSSLVALPRMAAELALSDRELLRHVHYVQMIEDERKRFARMPNALTDSPLGRDVSDALELARDLAIRHAGELARARYERELDALNEQLIDNVQLLRAALAGQRGELDPRRVPLRVTNPEKNVVTGDDEHVIWPFTGELWPDEIGTLRQSIRSKCAR